jgi:hypothetical protein
MLQGVWPSRDATPPATREAQWCGASGHLGMRRHGRRPKLDGRVWISSSEIHLVRVQKSFSHDVRQLGNAVNLVAVYTGQFLLQIPNVRMDISLFSEGRYRSRARPDSFLILMNHAYTHEVPKHTCHACMLAVAGHGLQPRLRVYEQFNSAPTAAARNIISKGWRK